MSEKKNDTEEMVQLMLSPQYGYVRACAQELSSVWRSKAIDKLNLWMAGASSTTKIEFDYQSPRCWSFTIKLGVMFGYAQLSPFATITLHHNLTLRRGSMVEFASNVQVRNVKSLMEVYDEAMEAAGVPPVVQDETPRVFDIPVIPDAMAFKDSVVVLDSMGSYIRAMTSQELHNRALERLDAQSAVLARLVDEHFKPECVMGIRANQEWDIFVRRRGCDTEFADADWM